MQQYRRTYFEIMGCLFLYNPVYRYIDVAIHQNLKTMEGAGADSWKGQLIKMFDIYSRTSV